MSLYNKEDPSAPVLGTPVELYIRCSCGAERPPMRLHHDKSCAKFNPELVSAALKRYEGSW